MPLEIYKKLRELALTKFSDIVEDTDFIRSETGRPRKLRIYLIDGTFLDIWYSLQERHYSYHWERKDINGKLYRHDNAPHHRWLNIKTFPRHFHDGSDENVTESNLPEGPEKALYSFLTFCRKKLSEL